MALKRTPLFEAHVVAGAKMVDFAGWEMPIHYGSQLKEHEAVRTDAGVFDVSHMAAVDISGADAKIWLQTLLANDVAKLTLEGKALYTAMLTPNGTVIDDLIVYSMGAAGYRVVLNAGCADKDLTWMQRQQVGYNVTLTVRRDLAILAVQGPQAIAKIVRLKPAWAHLVQTLPVFHGVSIASAAGDWFIARTGYTGEDGLELMVPNAEATQCFNQLLDIGVAPAGLGARDTLRLEAGMNLYGHDMDEQTSALAAGMGWSIAWTPAERAFIGRAALEAERAAGVAMKQVGLVLEGRGVLREGMVVHAPGLGDGIITSGTYSPTLKQAIAIARVPAGIGQEAYITLRGATLPLQVVKMPFVRNGQKMYTLFG